MGLAIAYKMWYTKGDEGLIKNGWVVCPKCGKKLFPIHKNTVIINLTYKCRNCGWYFKIQTGS